MVSCNEHGDHTITTEDGRRYRFEYRVTRTWHLSNIFKARKVIDYSATQSLTRLDGKDAEPMQLGNNFGLVVCPKGTTIEWNAAAGKTLSSKPCVYVTCTEGSDCPDFSNGVTSYCKGHRCT